MKIDAVILWVDGEDENWIKKKQKYDTKNKKIDSSTSRFRDWDTLRYLIRGIDKFMPWINNIYLITDNQKPKWIKESKGLKILNHSDFIPKKYLPTFNSNAIEVNLHRIKELSETFILFNDDMLILKDAKPTDFFKNGKPCDNAIVAPIIANNHRDSYKTRLNNIKIINKYFDKNKTVREKILNWINPKYGVRNYQNIALIPWKKFPGFYDDHLPISHLKSTFEKLWEKEYSTLDNTSRSKFRNYESNVSHWLFRYWNIASNNFTPRSLSIGKSYEYKNDTKYNNKIYFDILHSKNKLACINDSDELFDFKTEKIKLTNALNTIMPKKSKYEK